MNLAVYPTAKHVALVVPLLCAVLTATSLLGQSQNQPKSLVADQRPEGVLEPWKTSSVACPEQGLLESLFVKPGDQVKAGAVLAQLDSTLSQIQLEIASSQAAALGRIETAKAEVELAEKKARSIQQAREKKFSTQSELDRAEAEYKISRGRLQAELDESAIIQLQSRRMEELLRQRKVISPIDGIVEKVLKSPGEYVSPTSPEVVRIVDISKLRASFFLQVQEIENLKIGSKLEVEITGGRNKIGTIDYMAPYADGESGLIEVQLIIENPELKIWGSRCLLKLTSGEHIN
jgi:RND family efflux transporter MFP subunit